MVNESDYSRGLGAVVLLCDVFGSPYPSEEIAKKLHGRRFRDYYPPGNQDRSPLILEDGQRIPELLAVVDKAITLSSGLGEINMYNFATFPLSRRGEDVLYRVYGLKDGILRSLREINAETGGNVKINKVSLDRAIDRLRDPQIYSLLQDYRELI